MSMNIYEVVVLVLCFSKQQQLLSNIFFKFHMPPKMIISKYGYTAMINIVFVS